MSQENKQQGNHPMPKGGPGRGGNAAAQGRIRIEKGSGKTAKRLLSYIGRGHSVPFVLALLCIAGDAFISTKSSLFLGTVIDDYIKPMEIPVIFLTAKGSTDDKVKGLKLGADDYLTKPFEIVELLARVESILRRAGKTQTEIVVDDVVIDTRSRSVRRGSREIPLTMKEYELLLLFARNKNIALFRETLYEHVWGSDYMGDSRTVDLHVQRLRKKLHWEDKIKAIYKVGYRLEV